MSGGGRIEVQPVTFQTHFWLCLNLRKINGTSPEQSWDNQARFESPKNILKDYRLPLRSSHPVYRRECRSVHRKSGSKPIGLHANK